MRTEIFHELSKNMEEMKKRLVLEDNFDIVYRCFTFGEKQACLFFIDGFSKDDVQQKLLQSFISIKKEDMPSDMHEMSKLYLPYGEVGLDQDFDSIITQLLSGVSILFMDGFNQVIGIDCRTYPARDVAEPEKDKVLRGSKDGFVETLIFNTALVRRRIRNTSLRMKMFQIGEISKTDVCVCYMADRVDQELLSLITKRLENIKVEALTMNQQSLAECLYHHKWYNPFPKFRFSERPDTAAASILEGNIIIFVDNSPSAMILPTTIFDIIEEADDYYFPPVTGSYLRLSRFLTNLVALFLTPVFLLLIQNPQWIPDRLSFIQIEDTVNIPVIVQLLLLEFAIDGLKLAALNTPDMLSTPLSVVAALVLGDFTVSSGWFNAEPMLYMAFVAIATYTQASYELGYAMKFMRIILLILTYFFNWIGFLAGLVLCVVAIVSNRSISGKSYIYPLIPFHFRKLMKHFVRVSLIQDEKMKHRQ